MRREIKNLTTDKHEWTLSHTAISHDQPSVFVEIWKVRAGVLRGLAAPHF
jgi:hypothetical protein